MRNSPRAARTELRAMLKEWAAGEDIEFSFMDAAIDGE
jgi:hypothetical protein